MNSLKKIRYIKLYLVLFGVVILNACYYDNLDEMHPAIATCDTMGTVSYANDISSIMLHSCGSSDLGCHNGQSSESGYGLGNYNDLITSISNSTDFLGTITHSPDISTSKWMPKNSSSKIDDCSIQKITAWLNRGKLDN